MGNRLLAGQLAVPVGIRPSGGSAVPWYMLVGTPLAAYQPKGAASQAASYINVVNPGVHDLTVGNAPAWAANTGWTFTRASSHYLISTIVPATGYSVLVQISGGVPGGGNAYCALGCSQSGSSRFFGLFPNNGGGSVGYHMGDPLNVAPNVAAANLGLAGQQGYRNGVADGGAIGNTNGIPPHCFLHWDT